MRTVSGDLGANPVEVLTHELGIWTLRLLLLALAITPLRVVFGWLILVRFRRIVGVTAFFYALLHFLVYAVLDRGLDLGEILSDLTSRTFVIAGGLAFLVMVALAATSFDAAVRAIGPLRWRRLHRSVYVCGVCAVAHYIWGTKGFEWSPWVYALILGFLLLVRLKPVSKRVSNLPKRCLSAIPFRWAAGF